jgi:hypothetical protein
MAAAEEPILQKRRRLSRNSRELAGFFNHFEIPREVEMN